MFNRARSHLPRSHCPSVAHVTKYRNVYPGVYFNSICQRWDKKHLTGASLPGAPRAPLRHARVSPHRRPIVLQHYFSQLPMYGISSLFHTVEIRSMRSSTYVLLRLGCGLLGLKSYTVIKVETMLYPKSTNTDITTIPIADF